MERIGGWCEPKKRIPKVCSSGVERKKAKAVLGNVFFKKGCFWKDISMEIRFGKNIFYNVISQKTNLCK